MKIKVNADECRKDSPLFRASIDAAEQSLAALETKLEKVIKLCNAMVDAGKSYGVANSAFVNGVQDMTSYYAGDPVLEKTLSRFAEALTEIQGFHTILLDQASRSVLSHIKYMLNSDLRHVRESQSKFRRASDDLDTALSKHVGAPKNKPAECDEAANQLLVCRSKFTAMSLEYADKLNMFNEKQRHDVLQTMFSYLTAQSTYFHQGHDLFEDDDSFMKDVAVKLVELTDVSLALSKESEERRKGLMQTLTDCRQSIIGAADEGGDTDAAVHEQSSAVSAKVSGFLFRRTSKGFKAWVRRWFTIENNQLVYTKKLSEGWTVMEEDLRLCVVKPHADGDRRFCFEVKSPARSHILQATDDEECEMWMRAIQAGVVAAYSDRSRTLSLSDNSLARPNLANSSSLPLLDNQHKAKASSQAALLFTIPGNEQCADCSSRDPRWASVNLGITLCIECSGVHRSLGVHISKVRSITLDSWEPEVLKVMAELGNTIVNSIYEYSYIGSKGTVARPSSSSNSSVRETFIKCKYVECRYVRPLVTDDKSNTMKRWTVARRQRKTIMLDSMTDELVEPSSGVSSARREKTTPVDDEEVVMFGLTVNEPTDKFSADFLDDSSGSEGSEDIRLHTSIEEVERLDPNLLLYKAAEARNIPILLQGLANKADINWKNSSDDSKTSLIKAVESGSLATCEFLLLNSANVDAADSNGQTALHHATLRRHTAQVCQLLKRGADYKHRDKNQLDALMLAMRSEQADIVTLLRVANLRQEMTDADPGSLTDDSLNDIIRDFTHLASNDPDRLRRGAEKYGSTNL